MKKLLIFILICFITMAEFKTRDVKEFRVISDDIVGGNCMFFKVNNVYSMSIYHGGFIVGMGGELFLQIQNENDDMIIVEADCSADCKGFCAELSKEDTKFIMGSKEITITTFDVENNRYDFCFETNGLDFKKLK